MKVKDVYPNGDKLWFNDFYQIEQDIYFSACNYNSLYKYSLNNHKLEWLGTFGDEKKYSPKLYGKIIKVLNKLYVIPQYAKTLGIYDLEEKTINTISLPDEVCSSIYGPKFYNVLVNDNSLFLFPGYTPYILEYNVSNSNWIIHNEWYSEYRNKYSIKSELLFQLDFVKKGNFCFLPASHFCGMMRYDIKNNTYNLIKINFDCRNLTSLAYDNKFLWTCTSDNYLLKINFEGEVLNQISLNEVYGVKCNIYQTCYMNGYIYLFLDLECKYIKINVNNPKKEFEIIEYSEKRDYSNYEYACIDFLKNIDGAVCFFSKADRRINKINESGFSIFCDAILPDDIYANTEFDLLSYYEENTKNGIMHEIGNTKESINCLLRYCGRIKN